MMSYGSISLPIGGSRLLRQFPLKIPSAVRRPRGITIWKLGLDIGYTQNGVMVWTVFAPAFNLAPGALAGIYAGGTASVTVGLGVGANGLVGGSFNSIVLQPISIETNQGLNVAAGIASLTLEPAPELAGPAR